MNTPVVFNLPDGHEISNYLYPEMAEDDLNENLLAIKLPGDVHIGVSWKWDSDDTGAYWVHADWPHGCLSPPIEAKTVQQVQQHVQSLIDKLSSSSSRSATKAIVTPLYHLTFSAN
jgi:hypothetical protein